MCGERELFCFCTAGGILTTISKKWTLLIINILGNRGRLRFNDLMNELDGINPQTLSETLKDLIVEKLVERESFPESPPRVEYFLTPEGTSLREAILPLLRWASERDLLEKDECEKICRRRGCRIRKSPCPGKGKNNRDHGPAQ